MFWLLVVPSSTTPKLTALETEMIAVVPTPVRLTVVGVAGSLLAMVIVALRMPAVEGLNWTVTGWLIPCAIVIGKLGAGCSE